MGINFLVIILILATVAYAIFRYIKLPNKAAYVEEENYDEEEFLTIDYLVNATALAAAKTLRQNLADRNYTKEELEAQQKKITDLIDAMDRAGYGDPDAKYLIKEYIESFLTSEFAINTHEEINQVIPFDRPDALTGNERMEILYHVYKKCLLEQGSTDDAMASFITEYELDEPELNEDDGLEYYVVTKDKMKAVYESVMLSHDSDIVGNYELTLKDKQQILVQRVYEKWIGKDVIDMFYESAVDEIMSGVSGIPSTYRIPKKLADAPMSYESVWIMFHGLKINFDCLSFETYENYKRVLDNIYKFESAYVLSKAKPGIQGTMEDGSRIVVARNPFASSDAIWLRKFDTAEATKLHNLFAKSDYDFIPIMWTKWAIKAEQNSMITGAMGSGKTTTLRAVVGLIDPQFAIGTYEKRFELNLNYTYPLRNIIGFQECDMFDEQGGIDFGKKTSRDVTIIGEIANKGQWGFYVQTCDVASRIGLGSNHSTTTESLVDSAADALVSEGLYVDKADAVRAVIKVLSFDIHQENTHGNRHLARMTQIVPLKDAAFPSEREENAGAELKDKFLMDASYYMIDQTKKRLFEVRDIYRWVPDDELEKTGHYEFVQMPTEEKMHEIKMTLNDKQRKEFEEDLFMMETADKYYNKGNPDNLQGDSVVAIEEWIERIVA